MSYKTQYRLVGPVAADDRQRTGKDCRRSGVERNMSLKLIKAALKEQADEDFDLAERIKVVEQVKRRCQLKPAELGFNVEFLANAITWIRDLQKDKATLMAELQAARDRIAELENGELVGRGR